MRYSGKIVGIKKADILPDHFTTYTIKYKEEKSSFGNRNIGGEIEIIISKYATPLNIDDNISITIEKIND